MIIFDLDGTLADCDHRRHLVDIKYAELLPQYEWAGYEEAKVYLRNKETKEKWKPDWKAFYEACDKDKPIDAVMDILDTMEAVGDVKVEIWSGRCESVRKKTEKWFGGHLGWCPKITKMRPVGDSTPDDELKQKWLDELKAAGYEVEFVFDDRPKVIRMWRQNGIFVFNCCQHDEEF